MSFRSKVTIITLFLLALLVYLAWPQITQAFHLLGRVNIWIFLLLIPIQFFSYYATGEMIFSYLRSKGNLQTTTKWQMTRMALELNFVNHILPSGGAAGFSYLGWVLHRHGVSPGRATMAQIVRFALTFISFVGILIVAVLMLTFDHRVSRLIISISLMIVFLVIAGIIFVAYVIGSKKRLSKLANFITRYTNNIMRKLTRGKKPEFLKLQKIETFFVDMHQDYLEIRSDKKILVRPLVWSIIFNFLDMSLILVAFLALGFWVNPAIIFMAFGTSAIVGILSATPGGAGVYEAVMIALLVSAGVPADVAIAGTLLARVTLILGTILFGYIFYQLTINKYGKATNSANL